MTSFDEYQAFCKTTAVYPYLGSNAVYPALGLAGEAGEVAEKIKKMWRDQGHPSPTLFSYESPEVANQIREAVKKELGDVMWYVAQVATEMQLSLGEIVKTNITKLSDRKQRDKLHGAGDNR